MSQMHPPYADRRLPAWMPPNPEPVVPGTKFDAQKTRPALVIMSLAGAMHEVSKVMTFGAAKYSDNGWHMVENGVDRYTNALFRHLIAEGQGMSVDHETGLLHAAHAAANALIRLELMLREDNDIPF